MDFSHASVRELEIQYNIGKISVLTYGRGVWESNLNIFLNSVNSLNPNLIKVFPNPTSEELTIKTLINSGFKGMVCFYNITGQLVFTKELFRFYKNICK